MKNFRLTPIAVVVTAYLLLAGCASAPSKPAGADQVRQKLAQLQADPQLATRAPVAINEAEVAVKAAEEPRKKKEADIGQHLVQLANSKVEIATAQAQTQLLEDQRKDIAQQRQINELNALNAKKTDRGLVVTLGDVLFETGKAQLNASSAANLSKLSAFLKENPERMVVIEGHTDSQGNDDFNRVLSQHRADSVRNFLLSQGIASNRLTATGMGESSPVTTNDTSSGRQMNRRVEVIIADAPKA